MFFSPPNLAVLVLFAQPASETVPRLDVEPRCAAARVGDNLDASMRMSARKVQQTTLGFLNASL